MILHSYSPLSAETAELTWAESKESQADTLTRRLELDDPVREILGFSVNLILPVNSITSSWKIKMNS